MAVAYEALRDFLHNGQAFKRGEVVRGVEFRNPRLLESARYIRPLLTEHPPSKKRQTSTTGGGTPPSLEEEKGNGTQERQP